MRTAGLRVVSACLIMLSLGGCAGPKLRYEVGVNTFCAPDAAPIQPGARVHVWISDEDQNDLFKQEVAGKIKCLLTEYGYVVSDFIDSEYSILFGFGIGQHDEAYTKYVYQHPGKVASNFAEGVALGLASNKPVESVRTVNDRWFCADVVDVVEYLESNEVTVVWSCETRSSGSSSDLRDVLDYMLVPSLENFGTSTGSVKEYRLTPNSKKVKRLRAGCTRVATPN